MSHRVLQSIRDGLLGLAYPQHCRICSNAVQSWDDGVVCADCWEDPAITRIQEPAICVKCGAALSASPHNRPPDADSSPQPDTSKGYQYVSPPNPNLCCGVCSNAPFASARACGVYSGGLEASILFLKVTPHICPRLRRILLRTFYQHQNWLSSDRIIPVPLHSRRKRERGFNQAEIIARVISRDCGIAIDGDSLRRIKPTERHRAGLDAKDRLRSVEKAFAVQTRNSISGKSVLLVDDVYTTGSTINAACVALLEAGAGRVSVLTLARVDYR